MKRKEKNTMMEVAPPYITAFTALLTMLALLSLLTLLLHC